MRIQSLLRTGVPEEVEDDFCLYGIMTANFWNCFQTDAGPSWHIERCLRRITNGPLLNMDTREDWGPLEFLGPKFSTSAFCSS